MVVVTVDQYDLEVTLAEFVCQFQTAETAAYDDYTFFVCLGKIEAHLNQMMNEKISVKSFEFASRQI